MSNVIDKIKELNKEGRATKYIRAYLTMEGYSDKVITGLLKEAGVGRSSSKWTQSNTLNWLGEDARTERELYEKILENDARNEARWVNDRNKVRGLLNAVYSKFTDVFEDPATPALKLLIKNLSEGKTAKAEPEPEPEPELNERDAAIKAAWDKLNAAIKKGKKNRSIHPDKVDSLKDAELYKAYEDFFKKYNS